MSHVTCQISWVTFHLSCVTSFHLIFSDKLVELIGGGSVSNGAYPAGLSSFKIHLKTPALVKGLQDVEVGEYNQYLKLCVL